MGTLEIVLGLMALCLYLILLISALYFALKYEQGDLKFIWAAIIIIAPFLGAILYLSLRRAGRGR